MLTAEEVAALDLTGVEWAVLSGCDTGVGEVRAGEGVFGLRRAFQVAGAKTVIMSLWQVEDQATRQWMTTLYKSRFIKNLSTVNAVREAGLAVLRGRRAKGLTCASLLLGSLRRLRRLALAGGARIGLSFAFFASWYLPDAPPSRERSDLHQCPDHVFVILTRRESPDAARSTNVIAPPTSTSQR